MLLGAGVVSVFSVGATVYFLSGSKKRFPRPAAPIATTVQQLDETIEKVATNKEAWVALPNAEKLAILQEMRAILDDIQDEVGAKSDELRGYTGTAAEGMGSVLGLVPTASYLRGLIEVYQSLSDTDEAPAVMGRRHVGDTEVVQTHPRPGVWQKLTNGMRVELWGEPGKPMPQARPDAVGLCGVLCAGNFEGPVDVLHKMFIEQQVAICKNHPVNARSTAVLHAKLLAPLVERGFAGVCTGGVEVSSRLVSHDLVDNWMMTGGASTFDAIVWGGPRGKAAGKKVLTKECHAELGAASPYIVAPGAWTDAEVTYNARMLLYYKAFNSGHICASPQTVLLDSSWPQARQFVAALEDAAAAHPVVKPYYPGAAGRVSAVAAKYANSKTFDKLGLAFVPDVDAPGNEEPGYILRNESFAAALAIKYLDGNNDAASFLDKAVSFVNKNCFGSLSCSLAIDPRTQAALGDAFDRDVLGRLEWGTIAVNTWGGMGASNPYGVWGAHKDAHTPEDIQSGIGFMGNCLFVQNVQKQVIYGKWCDPGPIALFAMSPKTKAIGKAFSNMGINGGFKDFLCLIKAIVMGR